MNNSDFLSDAVALDLGKSGVKVAETLEIEVGDEWWRLINASDVTDGNVFQGRRVALPLVTEGEIHLNGLVDYRGPTFYPYGDSTTYTVAKSCSAVLKDNNNGLIYGVFGQGTAPGTSKPAFRVFDSTGMQLGSDRVLSNSYFWANQWLIGDAVNNRFIAVTGIYANLAVFIGAADGSSFAMDGGRYQSASGTMHRLQTFLEDEVSDYIYTLHLSGGSFYFKKLRITVGASAIAMLQVLCRVVDGTKLLQVTNHENSAFLFYSRVHTSVGVMWRDSAQGMKFILESEGFATVHDLPDAGGGSKKVFSFGNLVVPNEGEFLVAGVSDLPSGVLVRPTGWVYPANLTIVGAGEVSENIGVVLGIVGTTLYHMKINLTTKSIIEIFTVGLSVAVTRNVRLMYADATHEIWVHIPPDYGTYVQQNNILCINTASQQLQWQYSLTEWAHSSVWGSNTGTWGVMCVRLGSDKVLFRKYYSGPYTYIIVSLSALLQCASIGEVETLLSSGRTDIAIPGSNFLWDSNILWNQIVYDTVYNYIISACVYSNTLYFSTQSYLRASDTLQTPLHAQKIGSSPSNYHKSVIVGAQKHLATGLEITDVSPSGSDVDGYLALFSGKATGDLSMWRFYNITGVGALSLVGSVVCGKHLSTLTYPPESIPLENDPNARLAFFYDGTILSAYGAHHSGNNFGGGGQRVTIPFTAYMGMPCPESRRYIALSAVANGEISWAEMDGQCGQYRQYKAYRSTDPSDVYDVTGLDVSGGMPVINFQGRAITGMSGVGRMGLLDLQAADDDGYDEASGEGYVNIIYEYLTRNYIPYPFAREGIRTELSNISKTTKLTLPETQDHMIRGLLAAGTDFRGSRCILRRIFPDHADEEGSDIILLDGYIQDWSYVPEKSGIAFTVSKTLIDVGGQFPKRLMNMGCSHVFKGDRCRYLGEEGRCLKTRAFCTSLGNLNQFGGFPWVAARQRRVMWK